MKILSNTLNPFTESYTTHSGQPKSFVADIEGEVKVLVFQDEVYEWGGPSAVTNVHRLGTGSQILAEYIAAGEDALKHEKPKGVASIDAWSVKSCSWSGLEQGWLCCLSVRKFESEDR